MQADGTPRRISNRRGFPLPRRIALVLGVCLCFWPSAAAAPQSGIVLTHPEPIWLSSGPDGASITSLLIDKNQTSTVYITCGRSGVLKSTDGGASWKTIRKNLEGESASGIALDYLTGALFVGTSIGISKSADGGETWSDAGGSIFKPLIVFSLAADPSSACTVFAGTDYGGLYKTVDCGSSWHYVPTVKSSPYSDVTMSLILFDPTDPRAIYTDGDGVIRSLNGGFNWRPANSGLNIPNSKWLTIQPGNPSTLYVATTYYCSIFKSTDQATTWKEICLGNDYEKLVNSVAAGAGVVYAVTESKGILRSFDEGKTWTSANSGLGTLTKLFSISGGGDNYPFLSSYPFLTVDPDSSLTVYAAVPGAGVLKTTDGGDSWNWASAGTGSSTIHSIAIDPSSPDTIYAAADSAGLFRSTNGAGSWTKLDTDSVDRKLNAVALDPTNPSIIYLGTGTGNVFKSTDGGATFSNSGTGLPGGAILNLAIDPSHPNTLYVSESPDFSQRNATGGVYKTVDGGATWVAANNGLGKPLYVSDFSMSPTSPSLLFLTTYGAGIFRSSNGGTSWSSISSRLPSSYINTLAIDPTNANTLYASIEYGFPPVWKTTNGGLSWSITGDGIPEYSNVISLAVDPLDARTVYAGVKDGGVYRSTDGGGNWTPFSSGMETATVTAFGVHPQGSDRVYANTIGHGLARLSVRGLHEVEPR